MTNGGGAQPNFDDLGKEDKVWHWIYFDYIKKNHYFHFWFGSIMPLFKYEVVKMHVL